MTRFRAFVLAVAASALAGTSLTNAPAAIATPQAPPSKLAYVGTLAGQPGDIYVANHDGTGAINITNTSDRDEVQPAFSPDGQRLVFRTRGSGLGLINADGTGLTQLTSVRTDQAPDWSPDGTQIVFSRCCDSSRFDSELYIVNSDGSNAHRILDNDDVQENFPSWSPDGRWIVFTANPVGVFQIRPDGTDLQYLMSEFYGRIDFDWSPGGNAIVFAEYQSFDRDDANLQGMEPFGSVATELTSGPDLDLDPAWTPNARKVSFARTPPGGTSAIYLMNPDGTAIQPLTSTSDELSESDPTWQPI